MVRISWDVIAAFVIAVLLAIAFTWIAEVSRDFVLLALAWFVVLLVAALGARQTRGEEGGGPT
ncbi:MAG: hypothetical protein QXP98_06340 [Thermoproteus sp.]